MFPVLMLKCIKAFVFISNYSCKMFSESFEIVVARYLNFPFLKRNQMILCWFFDICNVNNIFKSFDDLLLRHVLLATIFMNRVLFLSPFSIIPMFCRNFFHI
jgi:hypothetical protein